MLEIKGNLWQTQADARCITTNGFVKQNGECVMGRGCAKEARDMHPGLARQLGTLITQYGNIVHDLSEFAPFNMLYSFPVKHAWNQLADPALIALSAEQLLAVVGKLNAQGIALKTILIPRPGCGNGGLKWEKVKPILSPILDDRFHIITF
jgi:hypothetical protein